jgi:hypothetical protein
MSIVGVLRAVLLAVAWMAAAAAVAFGGAGIVAVMTPMPATPARAELTWAGDRQAVPALDAATVRLEALAGEVDGLSTTALAALTQVVDGDTTALQGTIAEGTGRLAAVQAASAELESSLLVIPYTGPDAELHVSGDVRHRYAELAGTSGVAGGLERAWAAIAAQALDAASVSGLLSRHDEETAAAAAQGSAGHYKQALKLLRASDATIATARELQDRLAARADVSTLASWLDRDAAYDTALRNLYDAMLKSKGRVTGDVRAAFAAEKATREALPADKRGYVVIMSEIAQGGLNQAVIAIEEARGTLADALAVQQRLKGGGQLPE